MIETSLTRDIEEEEQLYVIWSAWVLVLSFLGASLFGLCVSSQANVRPLRGLTNHIRVLVV